jgi:hypothetical protein
MTLKDWADLATTFSFPVATLTFLLAAHERNKNELRLKIIQWQRVVVYGVVEQFQPADFSTVKDKYIVAAVQQQYQGFKIPGHEVQDGALKLVLLSLIEAKLILVGEDQKYVAARTSTYDEAMKEAAYARMQIEERHRVAIGKIFDYLTEQSGNFTIERLYKQLGEKDALGITSEDFNVLLRRMLRAGDLYNEGGKIFLATEPRIRVVQNTGPGRHIGGVRPSAPPQN